MSLYYAVARGKTVGIYPTWPECQAQVVGFRGAVYKKFSNENDAIAFIEEKGGVKLKGSPEGLSSVRKSDPTSDPCRGMMGNALKIGPVRLLTLTDGIGSEITMVSQESMFATPPKLEKSFHKTLDPQCPIHGHNKTSLMKKSDRGAIMIPALPTVTKPIGCTVQNNFDARFKGFSFNFRRELHETRVDLNNFKDSLTPTKEQSACLSRIDARIGKIIEYLDSDQFSENLGEQSKDSLKRKRDPSLVEGLSKDVIENNNGFKVDETGFVHVYTDGACSANGKGNESKAGVGVWWGDNHPCNVSEPVKGNKATNNSAEIQAAIRAIQVAKENNISKLWIQTDSMFLINCMTKWIHGWKLNDWKTKAQGDVINKDDLIELDDLINNDKDFIVRWGYVTAHRGVHGNEGADQLAKAGATQFKRQKL